MMAQSIPSKQKDFASEKSYVYIQNFENFSYRSEIHENGRQSTFLRRMLSDGQQKCTLTMVLYPAGYDIKNKDYVALHAFIDENIPYKIVVDVAILDDAYKEWFKRRIVLKNAYDNKGFIKDFAQEAVLRYPSDFLDDGALKIICRVVVVCKERKLVPDVSLLQNVLDNYEKLFGNEEFSDFKIKVGDTTFKVHKCILAAHSSVFAAMFHHDMSEKNRGSTDIPDVDAEVMKEFFRFIYAGKVEKLDELAVRLWVVADKYDVKQLKVLCEEALIEKLSVDTIVETLCLLDKFDMSQLKEAAIVYITNNAEQVQTDKFECTLRKLSSDLLTDVLCATLGKSKITT